MNWRMMPSMSRSALKPRRSARLTSNVPGQLQTICMMRSSSSTYEHAPGLPAPATRSRLSSICPGVTDNPGKFTVRRGSRSDVRTRAACTRLAITVPGDAIHSGVSSGTGQTVSIPASGSRMMPLTNDDAAALGVPGRTATVGRRQTMPSTNRFLEYSWTRSSAIAFSEPYDDCGRHRSIVRHHGRQRAAEHRERAREHEAGRLPEAAARVEQCPRRVDVDPHARGRTPLPPDRSRPPRGGTRGRHRPRPPTA